MIDATQLLREIIEAAAREGLSLATISRIVSMPEEDVAPYLPADASERATYMAMGMRLKTSPLESRILLLILQRDSLPREELVKVMDTASVDVLVCKLRKKLTQWGLTLHTVRLLGYQMSEVDRDKTWAIIRGERP